MEPYLWFAKTAGKTETADFTPPRGELQPLARGVGHPKKHDDKTGLMIITRLYSKS
jgi:hypothetical protein